MNSLEITCESCEAHMRLSPSLLMQLAGKTGRVTCRRCENKIVLDGRGGEVVVKGGGFAVDALDWEEVIEATGHLPHVDPHLSEFPRSVPPVLPISARLRRSQHTAVAPFEAPEPPPMRGQEDSLSPHAIGSEEEDGLVPLGREFNSSPFASERDETYKSLFPRPVPKKQ